MSPAIPTPGLPDPDGKYLETPQTLAEHLDRFIRNGWLNMVGGCCGTTEKHIHAIAEMAEGRKPREIKPSQHRTYFSGTEVVEVEESSRPLIVGERTNVIGSRAFKNLIAAEKWEEAVEIARRQVKNGAHIIDVCLQSTDRDEMADIPQFYEKLIRAASKPPIMIDTTDPKAIELALTYCQGKSIINSINLEDGEEKFEKVCPIAKAYGAALIVGTIDEDKLQAQAFTRERKLAVAQRSVELLTTKYGIAPEDIIIDPLVFPCGTGDANYIGGAVETIEAIRLIKQNIPYVRTVLGISNISFGLPAGGARSHQLGLPLLLHQGRTRSRHRQRRKAGTLRLHSREAAQARRGLCCSTRRCRRLCTGTTGASKLPSRRSRSISTPSKPSPKNFAACRRKEKVKAADLPLDQRLANYIIEGTKDGLIADLDLKRAEGAAPLDIVNGPLMAGMAEVGRLFNNNELIVAEVLQSAEAMKAGVSYLEQFMEKADTATRGKIILATVKGDVHDIGKNLVEIILSNNGYEVINLGIKIPPEKLIEAWIYASRRRHRALRPAGEERAADGDHGQRSEGSRHQCAAAGRRRGAIRDVHQYAHRPGLWRGRGLLCQGRHDRPADHESTDGSGRARSASSRSFATSRPSRWPRRPSAEEAAPVISTERSTQGSHRHCRFRRSLIWIARFAPCRSSPRSGATSIRSCCTAGIWATKAASSRTSPRAIPRLSNCSTWWKS